MVKIGRQKNRPNTLVSPAPVGWRTLAEKVYYDCGFEEMDSTCFTNCAYFIHYLLAGLPGFARDSCIFFVADMIFPTMLTPIELQTLVFQLHPYTLISFQFKYRGVGFK